VLVTVSSSAVRIGTPGESVDDAAAQGAMDTRTRGLAVEVAEDGIGVQAVRPGASTWRGTQAAGRRTAWLVCGSAS